MRRLVFWMGERVCSVGPAIDRACVAVDGECTVPDELEVVRMPWERCVVYAAEPSFARVARLWWPVSYALFWWPLVRLRRLGFWRVEGGAYLHTGWWSWPWRARDAAHWTPAEHGHWPWWRQLWA